MQSLTEALRGAPAVARINGWLRQLPVWAVYLLGALPFLWVVWLLVNGGLGVDPAKEIEHRLGTWGLRFLVGGLAITPLRRLAGLNLLKFRRAIGLLAFWYVLAHLASWVLIDMNLLWGQMLRDVLKRPYITIGMAAFVLLLPLALTSNSLSIRRLGARWRLLHRLVYYAAALGGLHYLLLVRAWPVEPLIYLGLITLALVLRLEWPRRGVTRGR